MICITLFVAYSLKAWQLNTAAPLSVTVHFWILNFLRGAEASASSFGLKDPSAYWILMKDLTCQDCWGTCHLESGCFIHNLLPMLWRNWTWVNTFVEQNRFSPSACMVFDYVLTYHHLDLLILFMAYVVCVTLAAGVFLNNFQLSAMCWK